MNYEKLLMYKVLSEDDPQLEFNKIIHRGIDKSFFYVSPDIWGFVTDHKKNYDKLPSIEEFSEKFGTDKMVANEPVVYYIDKLIEYKKFKLMSVAMDSADKLFSAGKVTNAIAEIKVALTNIDKFSDKSDDLSIGNSIDERSDIYEKRYNNPGVDGIPTGIADLDQITYGWHPGEFTIFMARLGGFKSWFLLHLALAALKAGYKPLIATVEMGRYQLARRFDSILTSTPFQHIRAGSFPDQQAFNDFKANLQSLKNLAQDCIIIGGQEFGESFLESKVEEHNAKIVFIDGLYLMSDDSKKEAEWQGLKSIAAGLKFMAERQRIPIIGTTQMDARKAEKKAGKEQISWMNYSMGMGQAADNVFSIGRIWDSVLEDYTNNVIVKALKLREGEQGRFKINFDFETMTLKPVMDIDDSRTDVKDKSILNTTTNADTTSPADDFDEEDMPF